MIPGTISTNSLQRSNDSIPPSHALQGASLAFSSSLASLKRTPGPQNGVNGARAAASFAGSETSADPDRHPPNLAASRPRTSYGTEEAFGRTDLAVPQQQPMRTFSGSSHNHASSRARLASREQSPSQIAALMAASRTTPTRDPDIQFTTTSSPRRPRPSNRHSDYWAPTPTNTLWVRPPTDDTPVAATNALIRLYETFHDPTSNLPGARGGSTGPPIVSPTPLRPSSAGRLSLQHSKSSIEPKRTTGKKGDILPSDAEVTFSGATPTAVISAKSAAVINRSMNSTKGLAPKPPPPRKTKKPTIQRQPEQYGTPRTPDTSSTTSSSSSYTSAVDKLASPRQESLAPRLNNSTINNNRQNTLFGSNQTNLRADDHASSSPGECSPPRPVYNKSSRSFDGPKHLTTRQDPLPTLSTTSLVPQLTANSLANAMVASSLASSRAPSPAKAHVHLPRRHGKPHTLFPRSHSTEEVSRTPSPAKQLRQTLRTTKEVEEQEQTHKAKRSHFMKKHPNKHHEGDRKRWRDTVSEAERKRYEGVWAANKGLLQPSGHTGAPADTVLGIIGRDIWRRSRLPDDVLEEIWNLVDMSKQGALGKEEFVVGMWLIDQRLKGRKLPVRVSESVWGSVRMLSGIRVPKHRK